MGSNCSTKMFLFTIMFQSTAGVRKAWNTSRILAEKRFHEREAFDVPFVAPGVVEAEGGTPIVLNHRDPLQTQFR